MATNTVTSGKEITDLTEETLMSDDDIMVKGVDGSSKMARFSFTTLFKALRDKFGGAAVNDVANNLTTTTAGMVLDARQGKVINDSISKVASDLTSLSENVIKHRRRLSNSDDLNTLIQPGFYLTTALTNLPANIPASNLQYASVLVYISSNDYVCQLVIRPNSRDFYIREYSGGSWKTWNKIACYANTYTSTSLCSGYITSSSKLISFFLSLPQIPTFSGVDFTKCDIQIRHVSGGYADLGTNSWIDALDTATYDLSINVRNGGLYIQIAKKDGSVWYKSATHTDSNAIINNSVISVAINYTVTFS